MQGNNKLKQLMYNEAQEQLTNTEQWYVADVRDALFYINKYTHMEQLYMDALQGKAIKHSVGKVIRYVYHRSNERLQVSKS